MLQRITSRTVPASRSLSSLSALEQLPDLPTLSPSSTGPAPLKESTLPNGVKVVSKDAHAGHSTVGVFVRAGSRYEVVPGTAHFLEHMAFKTTHTRSSLRVQRLIEDFGGEFDATASRDLLTYTGSSLRGHLDSTVEMLADTILHPKLRYWEVDEEKTAMAWRIEQVETDASAVVSEGLHAAAFGRNTELGRSRYCARHEAAAIDDVALRAHLGKCFSAPNIAIAATNVDHDDLVNSLMEHWLEVPDGAVVASDPSSFVGGESHIRTHFGAAVVSVGFSAPSVKGKNLFAAGVLQSLLGASSASFGAYHESGCSKRLPLALAKDGDLARNAYAAFSPYSDAGLFSITGTTSDANTGKVLQLFADTLKSLAGNIPADELDRAKANLLLQYVSSAEPSGSVEDMGVQALLAGKTMTIADMEAAISAVTAADVQAVIKDGLKDGVALSSVGSLEALPRYDAVNNMFQM